MQQSRRKAPATLELVAKVNEALSLRELTREDFRVRLNKYLDESRQIKSNHSGATQLSRWLSISGNWREPGGEIVIAMQKALKEIEKNH